MQWLSPSRPTMAWQCGLTLVICKRCAAQFGRRWCTAFRPTSSQSTSTARLALNRGVAGSGSKLVVMLTSTTTSCHRPFSKWSSHCTFGWLTRPSFSDASGAPHRTRTSASTAWCGNSAPKPRSVVPELWRWQLHLQQHGSTMGLLLSSTSCKKWAWTLVFSPQVPWSASTGLGLTMLSGRSRMRQSRVESAVEGSGKGSRRRNWQQKECSMRQESFEWQFWL